MLRLFWLELEYHRDVCIDSILFDTDKIYSKFKDTLALGASRSNTT